MGYVIYIYVFRRESRALNAFMDATDRHPNGFSGVGSPFNLGDPRLLTFGTFGRSAAEWSTCSLLCCRGRRLRTGLKVQGFPEDEMEHGETFFLDAFGCLGFCCAFRYILV